MNTFLDMVLQYVSENFGLIILVLILLWYRRPWGVLIIIIEIFWGPISEGLLAMISIAALFLGVDTSKREKEKED